MHQADSAYLTPAELELLKQRQEMCTGTYLVNPDEFRANVCPHFGWWEFACKDEHATQAPFLCVDLLIRLEAIRIGFGAPVHVISGYRTPEHNRKVGGAERSYHLLGAAADIKVEGVSPLQVVEFVRSAFGPAYGGLGLYRSWAHVDCRRGRAIWDDRG